MLQTGWGHVQYWDGQFGVASQLSPGAGMEIGAVDFDDKGALSAIVGDDQDNVGPAVTMLGAHTSLGEPAQGCLAVAEQKAGIGAGHGVGAGFAAYDLQAAAHLFGADAGQLYAQLAYLNDQIFFGPGIKSQ